MLAYEAGLAQTLERLARFARMGRKRDDLEPGRRSHRFEQHLILYRVEEDGITVARILHMKMDIKRQFDP